VVNRVLLAVWLAPRKLNEARLMGRMLNMPETGAVLPTMASSHFVGLAGLLRPETEKNSSHRLVEGLAPRTPIAWPDWISCPCLTSARVRNAYWVTSPSRPLTTRTTALLSEGRTETWATPG
jgi:hypothetical protein